jgi:Mn2+/Fe2+ NRAMP family transporter
MKKTNIWQRLGPGILLAATSIGASHLVLGPQAGALYGFELLWLVLVAHVFKYPAFEFGPRYAAATGKNLLAGYAIVPGPKNWSIYLFMVSTVLQGVGVLAGVVGISGCVLATWIGDPRAILLPGLTATEAFSLVVLTVVIVLLFAGGFRVLDHLNKVMMGILTLATLLAFVPVFPDPAEFRHFLIPTIPTGSIVLIAAILGWMPTGIDVSIWHSFWTLEKLKQLGAGDEDSRKSKTSSLKLALADMRLGYGLSFLTGIMFITIGAAHLTGMGAELKGVQFAEAMSTAYTAIFGRWMYHVFMMTAFFAMFSTSYTVIDGFSRAFSESMAILKTGTATERGRKKTYGGFVLGSGICAAATLVFVGNPVTVVLIVALISLAIAPVLYALNLYCVTRHIEDPAQRPATATVVIGWMGTVFMVVALVVTVYVKLMG